MIIRNEDNRNWIKDCRYLVKLEMSPLCQSLSARSSRWHPSLDAATYSILWHSPLVMHVQFASMCAAKWLPAIVSVSKISISHNESRVSRNDRAVHIWFFTSPTENDSNQSSGCRPVNYNGYSIIRLPQLGLLSPTVLACRNMAGGISLPHSILRQISMAAWQTIPNKAQGSDLQTLSIIVPWNWQSQLHTDRWTLSSGVIPRNQFNTPTLGPKYFPSRRLRVPQIFLDSTTDCMQDAVHNSLQRQESSGRSTCPIPRIWLWTGQEFANSTACCDLE